MRLDHWRGLLWLAPFAIVLGGAPAAADWGFQVPAGWVDLSGGKPAPPGMPAHEVAMARGCQAYAVDPASADNGYAEGMFAKVAPMPMVADEAGFAPFMTSFAQSVHSTAPATRLAFVEKGIVEIQGVPAMRVVADLTRPGKQLRMLVYMLPGGDTTAVITYTADPRVYDRYLPLFEANVRAVQGVARPPLLARVRHWLQGTWLGDLSPHDRDALFTGFGKVFGVAVVLVLFGLARRRKRAASSGTP
ncbi:MAG TPA: hypothetical protein VOA80_01570 [Thermoanaerobaculia bacterium]|nr:hypothetical protein [Thermoanaerobaculia bacterium]